MLTNAEHYRSRNYGNSISSNPPFAGPPLRALGCAASPVQLKIVKRQALHGPRAVTVEIAPHGSDDRPAAEIEEVVLGLTILGDGHVGEHRGRGRPARRHPLREPIDSRLQISDQEGSILVGDTRRLDGTAGVGVLVLAIAGCADVSPTRVVYEALQQHECATTTGVNCPQQAGQYDAYRKTLEEELGDTGD